MELADGLTRFPECTATASEFSPPCQCEECRLWRKRAIIQRLKERLAEAAERYQAKGKAMDANS